MGRSGTTLLQSILDNHSCIVVPPESYFMIHLDKKYGSLKKWDNKIISKYFDVEKLCIHFNITIGR